jgi:putative component of membrane protein insertase Oxa1/YidC/SpoIIIJ protein YidD
MYRFYRAVENIFKMIIRFCIVGLRPLLGPATCRYPIGCTTYALETLDRESLGKAMWLIIKRVVSCNPL